MPAIRQVITSFLLSLGLVAQPVAAQDSMGHGRIGGPPPTIRTVTDFPPGTRVARPTGPTGPLSAGSARRAGLRATAPISGAGGGGGAATLADTQWFWSVIEPSRHAARPDRLTDALHLMSQAPQAARFTPPTEQGLAEVARLYGEAIMAATAGTRVSPALVLAVISVESAGHAQARSHAGAQGLMQLIPATARRFHVANALDPRQNIRGGVAYLDWLFGHFGGDPILTLAGYNAGEGSVRDNNGVPPFAETRAYVPKVLSAWTVARTLCHIPPQHMSDACDFRL